MAVLKAAHWSGFLIFITLQSVPGDHFSMEVDLAKNAIYVNVLSSRQKLLQSKEVSRSNFKQFLANQKPAFEPCDRV